MLKACSLIQLSKTRYDGKSVKECFRAYRFYDCCIIIIIIIITETMLITKHLYVLYCINVYYHLSRGMLYLYLALHEDAIMMVKQTSYTLIYQSMQAVSRVYQQIIGHWQFSTPPPNNLRWFLQSLVLHVTNLNMVRTQIEIIGIIIGVSESIINRVGMKEGAEKIWLEEML